MAGWGYTFWGPDLFESYPAPSTIFGYISNTVFRFCLMVAHARPIIFFFFLKKKKKKRADCLPDGCLHPRVSRIALPVLVNWKGFLKSQLI